MVLTGRLGMTQNADMAFCPMSSPVKGCFLGHLLRLHLSPSLPLFLFKNFFLSLFLSADVLGISRISSEMRASSESPLHKWESPVNVLISA